MNPLEMDWSQKYQHEVRFIFTHTQIHAHTPADTHVYLLAFTRGHTQAVTCQRLNQAETRRDIQFRPHKGTSTHKCRKDKSLQVCTEGHTPP